MLTSDEIKEIAGESGLATSRVAGLREKYGANAMTPPGAGIPLEAVSGKIQ